MKKKKYQEKKIIYKLILIFHRLYGLLDYLNGQLGLFLQWWQFTVLVLKFDQLN